MQNRRFRIFANSVGVKRARATRQTPLHKATHSAERGHVHFAVSLIVSKWQPLEKNVSKILKLNNSAIFQATAFCFGMWIEGVEYSNFVSDDFFPFRPWGLPDGKKTDFWPFFHGFGDRVAPNLSSPRIFIESRWYLTRMQLIHMRREIRSGFAIFVMVARQWIFKNQQNTTFFGRSWNNT